ncbi:MAG: HAMP domain-containing sensor histidine kinase, partial [Ignavibacteria bacterium]|nr:HAMP domain-containing sensor histidine kinase [Ignavibacteria bacterium]
MQSSKIDFLGKYNELIITAINSAADFPGKLCDFIVKEFELEAASIFKLNINNNLELIGKSITAKKSLSSDIQISCPNCKNIIDKSQVSQFLTQSNCSFNITDHIINEGCILLNVANEQFALIKFAKKTPYSKSEVDNIELVSESIKNLLQLWIGSKGNLNNCLSTIISNIAQELRTPTNSIMGFASLLNEENLSPSQTEYVGTLKENAFELLSVINDLIDLSKLESGVTKINLTSVNFKDYLNEVVSLFSSKIDKSRIEFVTDIDSGIPNNIKIDTQKVRYILLNLLTNSVRLTERGKISVSVLAPNSKKLIFRISDTSPGLNAKNSTEFFHPFALHELQTSRFGNLTGLGLTLTKKYIEFLKGDISISSGVGKGITYTFAVAGEIL